MLHRYMFRRLKTLVFEKGCSQKTVKDKRRTQSPTCEAFKQVPLFVRPTFCFSILARLPRTNFSYGSSSTPFLIGIPSSGGVYLEGSMYWISHSEKKKDISKVTLIRDTATNQNDEWPYVNKHKNSNFFSRTTTTRKSLRDGLLLLFSSPLK